MKKYISFILAIVMILSVTLTGCEKNSNSNDTYIVYCLNVNKNGILRDQCDLKTGDTDYMIKYLISEMKHKSKDPDMVRPMGNNVNYQDYNYNERSGSLFLSFDRTYDNLEGVEESLTRACIVLTLLQVPGVKDVSFEVEHEPLKLGTESTTVGAMNEDSFVLSLTGDDSVSQSAVLNLLYPSGDGNGLIFEKKNVSYASNMSLERVVMKYLADKPKSKTATPALSPNVPILNMYVADGVCYLNLGAAFSDGVSEELLKLRVYAIVDSLCQLTRVKRVQISVEGKNLNISTDAQSKEDALYLPDESLILNKDDMGK
ncbi:MAG: GerMN domain-containing protein [Lachnospiraceae bacterium]|nr:GerMN domain-containing protein [Lachnospiraceae bacterium]